MNKRQGVVSVLASALAFLLVAGGLTLTPLERATVVDVAAAGAASDALAVAESAADEALLAFGRAANDPASETFRRARAQDGLLGVTGTWEPPAVEAREAAALAKIAGCTLDAPEVTVEVKGRTAQEVRGRVVARAAARTGGRRAVVRRVERAQGFRLARLGLPWPFTNVALFVHRPAGLLGEAPALMERLAADLAAIERGLAPVIDAPGLAPTARRLASLRRFYGAPFPWREASFYLSPRVDRVDDLAALSIAATARRLAARRTALGDEPVERAQASSGALGVDPATRELLEVAAELERELAAVLRRWVKVGHRSDAHRSEIDPGLAAALAAPEAWYELPSLAPFDALFPAGGAPGVIAITGKSEPLALTGDLGGRVVIAAAGPVRVRDVRSRAGLVTIVAAGPLEVEGEIEAHLVARAGLKVAPGARLRGQVLVEQGDIELGEGASLVADPRVRQRGADEPCAGLYHLALDPFRTTGAVE